MSVQSEEYKKYKAFCEKTKIPAIPSDNFHEKMYELSIRCLFMTVQGKTEIPCIDIDGVTVFLILEHDPLSLSISLAMTSTVKEVLEKHEIEKEIIDPVKDFL